MSQTRDHSQTGETTDEFFRDDRSYQTADTVNSRLFGNGTQGSRRTRSRLEPWNKPEKTRSLFNGKLSWDGTRDRFREYRRTIEGHLLQVNAGYLIDNDFQTEYEMHRASNQHMEYLTSDTFWSKHGVSFAQAKSDKHYLYGILLSTTTKIDNKIILANHKDLDGILAWIQMTRNYDYGGSIKIRKWDIDVEVRKPYFNTPDGLTEYIERHQTLMAELDIIAPLHFTDYWKQQLLLENVRRTPGMAHLAANCEDRNLSYEMSATYLFQKALTLEHTQNTSEPVPTSDANADAKLALSHPANADAVSALPNPALSDPVRTEEELFSRPQTDAATVKKANVVRNNVQDSSVPDLHVVALHHLNSLLRDVDADEETDDGDLSDAPETAEEETDDDSDEETDDDVLSMTHQSDAPETPLNVHAHFFSTVPTVIADVRATPPIVPAVTESAPHSAKDSCDGHCDFCPDADPTATSRVTAHLKDPSFLDSGEHQDPSVLDSGEDHDQKQSGEMPIVTTRSNLSPVVTAEPTVPHVFDPRLLRTFFEALCIFLLANSEPPDEQDEGNNKATSEAVLEGEL
jgi:hypothetical protein